ELDGFESQVVVQLGRQSDVAHVQLTDVAAGRRAALRQGDCHGVVRLDNCAWRAAVIYRHAGGHVKGDDAAAAHVVDDRDHVQRAAAGRSFKVCADGGIDHAAELHFRKAGAHPDAIEVI